MVVHEGLGVTAGRDLFKLGRTGDMLGAGKRGH